LVNESQAPNPFVTMVSGKPFAESLPTSNYRQTVCRNPPANRAGERAVWANSSVSGAATARRSFSPFQSNGLANPPFRRALMGGCAEDSPNSASRRCQRFYSTKPLLHPASLSCCGLHSPSPSEELKGSVLLFEKDLPVRFVFCAGKTSLKIGRRKSPPAA
jgi:hypothetical protein